MSESFLVFISHFTGEARIAQELQKFIRTAFPSVTVFRSSDAESIKTGQGQYEAILDGLRTARVVVVLLSSESAQRPWVAFETGFAMGKAARVFPLLVRGTGPGDVPSPFCDMQIRPIDKAEVEKVLAEIETQTKLKRVHRDIDSLLLAVSAAEAEIPNVRLEVEPYITGSRSNPALSFRLRYEGYQPLELQTVIAGIPREIKCPDWAPRQVVGHLDSEVRDVEGTPYLFQEYSSSEMALDPRKAPQFKVLRRVLLPEGTPFELPELRFALNAAIDLYRDEHIVRCRVVTTKFQTQEQLIPLSHLRPTV